MKLYEIVMCSGGFLFNEEFCQAYTFFYIDNCIDDELSNDKTLACRLKVIAYAN